jgi:hypothetical protein
MKYTDKEKQEVFNEWLQSVLSKLKTDAILSNADEADVSFGKAMNADDDFTADFKIILRRKTCQKTAKKN